LPQVRLAEDQHSIQALAALRNFEAQHQQFAMYPGRTP
jgi:hypothetical protein